MKTSGPELVLSSPVKPSHKPEKKEGLARNLAYMTASSAVIRSGSLIYAILIRRILGPQLIGVWNFIEILSAFFCTATIGVSYSSERLIPYYRARGDQETEDHLRNSFFSWSIAEGLLLSIGIIVYGFLFGDRYPENIRLGLYWLPFIFIFQKLLSIFLVLLKSAKAFKFYSVANVIGAFLDWSLIGWAFLWGLQGVFAGTAVIGIIKLIYFFVSGRSLGLFSFSWRLNLRDLRLHFPYGPSYSAFKILWTIAERADTLLVGYLLGEATLAFYYIGFRFSRIALEIPIALVYIAFPNMMERFSVSQKQKDFSREFLRYLRIDLFLILPMILPLGYFGSEFIIRHFLPEFSPGIVAVKISMMAVGMLAIRYLYYQILMAHKRVDKLILVAGVQLPSFMLSFFTLRDFFLEPLVAVSVAMFIAYGVHLGTALWVTRSMIEREGEWWFRFWGGCLFVVLGWAGLLMTIDLTIPGNLGGTIGNDFLQVALRVSLFGLSAFPIMYVGLGSDRKKVRDIFLKLCGG